MIEDPETTGTATPPEVGPQPVIPQPADSTLPDSSRPPSPDVTMADLRSQYPQAPEGVLFCVSKLQGDPHLSLPDIRDEAKLRGIKLGGRSIHSARVLLGLASATPRRRKQPPESPSLGAPKTIATPQRRVTVDPVTGDLIEAIQRIQDAATEESRQLREAIRKAVEILQRALEPTSQ